MNQLQKELFSKVYDLLMDSPRRLTHEDAEVALTEAWNKIYHKSLGAHRIVKESDLEKRYEVLSIGKNPHEALENWIKYDHWAKDEIHSYEIDRTARTKGNIWYLNYRAGADVLCAKGIYTLGGAVLTNWKSAGQTTLEYMESKSSYLAKGETIHSALVNWAWSHGWDKSLILDELETEVLNKNTLAVVFEVQHKESATYEAIVQKDDNKFFVLEVKEK